MEFLFKAKKQFNNSKLKKITNVYQLNYLNNIKPTGFGDYIKSCFFLIQLCNVLNLEFDMNFENHPISKCLKNNNQDDVDIDFSIVEYPFWAEHNYIDKHGLDLFIEKLNKIQTSNYNLFTNGWPILPIRQQGVYIIREKIVPNELLSQNISEFMNSLNLLYKNFITIHIRIPDEIFNEKTMDSIKMSKLINILKNVSIYTANVTKCLILTNNSYLKYYIKNINLKNICFKMIESVHLGATEKVSNVENMDNAVLDTMTDFFVMASSKMIISISSYGWGSCFSDMSSQLYNVPIIKMRI
jgi:hypothetical protein